MKATEETFVKRKINKTETPKTTLWFTHEVKRIAAGKEKHTWRTEHMRSIRL